MQFAKEKCGKHYFKGAQTETADWTMYLHRVLKRTQEPHRLKGPFGWSRSLKHQMSQTLGIKHPHWPTLRYSEDSKHISLQKDASKMTLNSHKAPTNPPHKWDFLNFTQKNDISYMIINHKKIIPDEKNRPTSSTSLKLIFPSFPLQGQEQNGGSTQ